MIRFVPHITFFSLIFAVILIGVATNSGTVGQMTGFLITFSIDPLIIIGGLLIGFISKGQIKLILFSVVFGVVASIIIIKLNSSLGATITPLKVVLRCIATLAWAYVANFFILIKRQPEQITLQKDQEGTPLKKELSKQKSNTQKSINDRNIYLPFKDGNAAIEYACRYLDCILSEGSLLPAVVIDAREEFGTDVVVKFETDGTQLATLRVASKDGGFTVPANTAGANGPKLRPGQLVAWKPMKYMRELGEQLGDTRSGWVGLIIGTLKLEYKDNGFVGDKQFLP